MVRRLFTMSLLGLAALSLAGCVTPQDRQRIADTYGPADPQMRDCLRPYDYDEQIDFNDPQLLPAKSSCVAQAWAAVPPDIKACLSANPAVNSQELRFAMPDDPRIQPALAGCQQQE